MQVLREYEKDGFLVIEYTRDGENVSVTTRKPIINKENVREEVQLSDADKLNFLYYKATGVIK